MRLACGILVGDTIHGRQQQRTAGKFCREGCRRRGLLIDQIPQPLHEPGQFRAQRLTSAGAQLDVLLYPREFRTEAVVLTLDDVETFVGHGLGGTLGLHIRFAAPLPRERCFQTHFQLAHHLGFPSNVFAKPPPAQHQQFQAHLARFGEQGLITLGRLGLPLQMGELTAQLFP